MIQDIIEQGEKEFEKRFIYPFGDGTRNAVWSLGMEKNILDWHTSQQHKLLQSIVEWIDKRCEANNRIHGTDKWNSDLEDLKAKLLEGKNK